MDNKKTIKKIKIKKNLTENTVQSVIPAPICNSTNLACLNMQRLWRGYQQRKNLLKLEDGMTPSLLNESIDGYINTINTEKQINTSLKKKKIRYSNFPSHISENIVKFAIAKKNNIMPSWDTDKGDLCINNPKCKFKHIEVKGSIDLLNGGPSSYGPTENWDEIYFVDAVENNDKIYTIYQVKLSSTSEKWKNITVSKTQTFADQCLLGRRPRLTFKELRSQLGEDCKLFFRGHLSEMF